MNVYICIAIFSVVYFSFGYCYYNRNLIERKKVEEKAEELKQNILKAEKQKEHEEKALIEMNIALKKENQALRSQLQLINTKNRRRKKRV